tara:strand:- start:212 stop:373 length:162 start_codon:yes stop_codon:yes gene_type:complete
MFPVGLIKEWIVLFVITGIHLVLGMRMVNYFGTVFILLVTLREENKLNIVWKI